MPRSSRRPPPSELELEVVLSAIRGSTTAFVRLFDHYQTLVRYVAARAALAAEYLDDVEDLAHEVWCRLLRDDRRLLTYFDPERGPFGPFIGRLAYQQALAAIRGYRRQVPDVGRHDQDDELEDWRMSRFTAELIQTDFYDKLLRRADAELDESDRLLLREVHLNQRTCRAVAEELGLHENTLYKRNERLKKKLATMASELLGSHGPQAAGSLALTLVLVAVALTDPATASFDDAMAPVEDPTWDAARDAYAWR